MNEDEVKLKDADKTACEMLNTIAAKGHQDLPTALLIVAIMYGRLRYDAHVQGAKLQDVDDLFNEHVKIFTDALNK